MNFPVSTIKCQSCLQALICVTSSSGTKRTLVADIFKVLQSIKVVQQQEKGKVIWLGGSLILMFIARLSRVSKDLVISFTPLYFGSIYFQIESSVELLILAHPH